MIAISASYADRGQIANFVKRAFEIAGGRRAVRGKLRTCVARLDPRIHAREFFFGCKFTAGGGSDPDLDFPALPFLKPRDLGQVSEATGPQRVSRARCNSGR